VSRPQTERGRPTSVNLSRGIRLDESWPPTDYDIAIPLEARCKNLAPLSLVRHGFTRSPHARPAAVRSTAIHLVTGNRSQRFLAASSCRAIRETESALPVHAAMAGVRNGDYSRRQREGTSGERFPAVRSGRPDERVACEHSALRCRSRAGLRVTVWDGRTPSSSGEAFKRAKGARV
jgi:hypothetical protein